MSHVLHIGSNISAFMSAVLQVADRSFVWHQSVHPHDADVEAHESMLQLCCPQLWAGPGSTQAGVLDAVRFFNGSWRGPA
eukprot:20834-Alexandrium_andersonii.AAC.1